MKAKLKPKYEPHTTILKDVVPLDTPFGMALQVSTICDAKCTYCFHSLPAVVKKQRGFEARLMEMPMVEKVAEQISQFPENIKKLQILGLGEPLCHPKLAEIIKTIKSTGKIDRISMTTNALTLTHEKSLGILEAGLDNIEFSIQGVNVERYREICGVSIDFDLLIERIQFFYNNRNKAGCCHTLVKTVDAALHGAEETKQFFSIFGDICDAIYVDNVIPIDNDVKYQNLSGTDMFGQPLPKTIQYTCAQLFYFLNIKPNGDVLPCCQFHEPIIGNIQDEPLIKIWDGQKRNNMMRMQLKKDNHLIPVCNNCEILKGLNGTNGTFEVDRLIDWADEILERMDEREKRLRVHGERCI